MLSMKITKDMIIGEVLDNYPQTAEIFLSFDMHCLHCPVSRGESIAEASEVHGIDAEAIVEALNKALDSGK